MNNLWPGRKGRKSVQSTCSEGRSSSDEGGVKISTRSLGNPKSHTQSILHFTIQSWVHEKAERERDMVCSPPHYSVNSCIS